MKKLNQVIYTGTEAVKSKDRMKLKSCIKLAEILLAQSWDEIPMHKRFEILKQIQILKLWK